ncbi:hypothetical protein RNJ44_00341 [Nakaseomyces bracarensis]|uniref:Uncharacterized protein n=1 Tax=Nakaseomyces bracarensis TaxID=273131 RepID=A0ABR4NSH8_9SACH
MNMRKFQTNPCHKKERQRYNKEKNTEIKTTKKKKNLENMWNECRPYSELVRSISKGLSRVRRKLYNEELTVLLQKIDQLSE